MVKVQTGEILTLYGSYHDSLLRARLSFYPSSESNLFIDGKKYQKVKYERGYKIPGLQKILNLPGEQHFLINRSQIIKLYRPINAFEGVSKEKKEEIAKLIEIFKNECNIAPELNGLGGTGALHSLTSLSDFDWVIYMRDFNFVKKVVVNNPNFKRELTFEMEHVYTKYAHFYNLSRADLDVLFNERWKYFRFRNLRVSISFVDPVFLADDFLRTMELGSQVVLEGIVTDDIGCYHTPRLLPLKCIKEDCVIITWLFLYNGAFSKGDKVRVSGRRCKIGNSQYVLVEESQDYIKIL